jgi:hypothetical protein
MQQPRSREQGLGVDTFWTVAMIVTAVATMSVVLWALVWAPFTEPSRSGKP